ncbi:MAG: cysteine desulfurase [Gemmatimonadetes bacterium]|nr:cysteine desulfurase [Gemmatimonadota bacterium]
MDPIYLDHAATTPVRDEVVTAMAPYMSQVFANPSSLHGPGRAAQAALEKAREDVADAIGARRAEVRFVRGGTESDNLAVLGSCRARRARYGKPPQLFVSSVEHSAVLEAAEHAEASGDARLTVLSVSPHGELDLEPLRGLDRTAPAGARSDSGSGNPPPIVSVMWVNNETGLILPVDDVVDAAAARAATVHTDASQALGKVPVDVSATGVDLLTATGHKIRGPRGTGLLCVREGLDLTPLLFGGGQERSLRPGTEDVAGAVGLAAAVRLAVTEQASAAAAMEALRRRLEEGLLGRIDGIRINGGSAPRAAHVSSVGIPGISDGQTLLMALDMEGLAVSGGSACHSGVDKGSHVIEALYGGDDDLATVRYSFGASTTAAEIDRAIAVTVAVAGRLRTSAEDAA